MTSLLVSLPSAFDFPICFTSASLTFIFKQLLPSHLLMQCLQCPLTPHPMLRTLQNLALRPPFVALTLTPPQCGPYPLVRLV